MSLHIAVDLGASSGRVALGRLEGGRLGTRILHRFPNGGVPLPSPGGMRLCWDVLGLWREVLHGLKLAAETVAAEGGEVASVGVNSWAVDYGLIDARGELLGHVHHYRSSRLRGVMEGVRARLPDGQVYGTTGIQFLPFNTVYQLMAEAPEQLARASTLLMVPDLLHFWLCGVAVSERSNASTTGLYDPRSGDWADSLLQELGLPRSLFPEIVPPGTVLGPLSPEVEGLTGLRGVQVVAPATHDTASAVAAVPAADVLTGGPGWAYVSSGTWSLVGVETARPVITPQTLEHNLTNEAGVGGTIRLLKNIMGLWMVQECCRVWGVDDFAALYGEAAAEPGGGAVIDPDAPRFLAPADMAAEVQALCRETGQRMPQTRAGIVRVVLDSLAHKTASVLNILEGVSGQSIRAVHIVGGGSQIGPLNQLVADISGRTVIAGPVEATLAGNLLVQAVGLGLLDPAGVREVVRNSVELMTFQPHLPAAPGTR